MSPVKLLSILSVSLLLTCMPVLAQQNSDNQRNNDQMTNSDKVKFGSSDIKYHVEEDVDKIVGKDVVNAKGEELGTVNNIYIADLGPGKEKILYAIISVGGFLGIGEKLVAVPIKNLDMSKSDDNLTLRNVSKTDLENAPAFEYQKAESGGERFPQYGPKQE